MSELFQQELADEIRKLRETGEALLERVEDVAASIRYLTNNLLDEAYHPEMADHLGEMAVSVSQLVTLSPSAKPDTSVAPFVTRITELVARSAEAATAGQGGKPPHERASPYVDDIHFATQGSGQAESETQAATSNGVATLPVEETRAACYLRQGGDRQRDFSPCVSIETEGGELVVVENSDGEVAIYTSEGEHLATEAGRTDAIRSAQLRHHGPHSSLFDLEELREPPAAGTLPNTGGDQSPMAPNPVSAESQASPHQQGMDSLSFWQRPYSLDDFRSFYEGCQQEELTAVEWKRDYARLKAGRAAFIAELNQNNSAQDLKTLAARFGCYDSRGQTKAENAAGIYRACLRFFVLGGSLSYNPMAETAEEAVDRIVGAYSEEDFVQHYAKRRQRGAEHQKAIENPETLLEFYTFISEKGLENLTDEQHLRRDRLLADLSRTTRRERQATTVEQFHSDELDGLEFSLTEGYHEKRQCVLWIVQLSTRVDQATYGELKRKASLLSGWYSSFKKNQSGFQFLSRDSAEKFMALKQESADRTEELEDRRIRKLASAGERFEAMAERLTAEAEATLAADDGKLKNTVRRAEQAASVRARAREDLATAKTLQSLASQLSEGDTTYLDGIRYAVQIETLRSILRRARRNHIQHVMETEHGELSSYRRNVKQDELESRLPDASDIRYAEYPKPYLYRGHLERAFAQLANTKGVKQLTTRMRKLVSRSAKDQDFVEFNNDHDIELLETFLGRARAAGYDCYWFQHCIDDSKRLRTANIHDAHELRAALAELLPHLSLAESDDPVTQAIDELRGKELQAFFPTPRTIIYRMLDLADIQGDDRVLEPSAGMGDILDAIRERHPDVDLKAIEVNHTLADVLAAKGYDELTTFADFLAYQWRCDKIVMNPPFENSADIDHVRHAYEQLSVGGRLVSVMCEGPFFRSDSKSCEFREWLEELGAVVEQLPDNTFQGVATFRQTGVRTRLVVIDKQ